MSKREEIYGYKVIWRDSVTDFEDEVNAYIADGWQPLGPPQVTSSAFMQTMVLYDETKKPFYGEMTG